MRKRILSMLLCLCMVVGLLPTVALATDTTGIDLSNATEDKSGNGWTWDNTAKKLTLFGVDISGNDNNYGIAVKLGADTTIELIGYNKISGAIAASEQSLTITGSGVLDINVTPGIAPGSLTIESGYVKIAAKNGYAVQTPSLTMKGGYLEVSNSSSLATIYGTDNATLTMEGGYLKATNAGTYESASYDAAAIRVKTATVSGGYLEASSTGTGSAIDSNVTNSGGVIKATASQSGSKNGIEGDFTASGGVTIATGGTGSGGSGMALSNSITLTGSEKAYKASDLSNATLTDSKTAETSLIIAKAAYSATQSAPDTLDGVYVKTASGSAATCNAVKVSGGSYLEATDNSANALKLNRAVTGTGTLVGVQSGSEVISSGTSGISCFDSVATGVQLIGVATSCSGIRTERDLPHAVGVGSAFGIDVEAPSLPVTGSLVGVSTGTSQNVYGVYLNETTVQNGASITGYASGSGVTAMALGGATISNGSVSGAAPNGTGISGDFTVDGGVVDAYGGTTATSGTIIATKKYASGLSEAFSDTETSGKVAYLTEAQAKFDLRDGSAILHEKPSATPKWGDNDAKDNYTFDGWYDGIDGTGAVCPETPDKGTTYYAKWENAAGNTVRTQALDLTTFNAATNNYGTTQNAQTTTLYENTAQGWSWDTASNTLTLDNCTINVDTTTSGRGGDIFVVKFPSSKSYIQVNNTNTVTENEHNTQLQIYGMWAGGALELTGAGSLSTTASGGFVQAGLVTNGDVTLGDSWSGTLTSTGKSPGQGSTSGMILKTGNFTISKGTVNADGFGYGLALEGGTVTINGSGALNVAADLHEGLNGAKKLTISGGSFTAKSNGVYGIAVSMSMNPSMDITNGTILGSDDGLNWAPAYLKDGFLSKTDDTTKSDPFKMVKYSTGPVAPTISVSAQPTSPAEMTVGGISGALSVTATASNDNAITYQWYSNTTNSTTGGTAISGATSTSLTIPATLSKGNYYYYCVMKATDCADVTTTVATVTVKPQTGNITGVVTKNSSPVSGATVTLMQGNAPVGVPVTTEAYGAYSFSAVEYGVYSVVVTSGVKTVTASLVLGGATATKNITIPTATGNENTLVETKAGTPNTSADLNELFNKAVVTEDDKGITKADKTAVSGGGTVEIKLTAEAKTESDIQDNATAIKKLANDSDANFLFVDLKVTKTVTPTSGSVTETTLKELNDLIQVSMEVPAEYRNANLRIFRIHAGKAEELKQSENEFHEKFELNSDYSVATLTIKRFSTFALSNAVTPSNPGGSNSNIGYTIATPAAENGKVTVSSSSASAGAKVTVTAAPNTGYTLKSLTVTDKNGKTVSTTKNADGTYSFTMPSANVTVIPVFAKTVLSPADTGVAAMLQTEDHIKYISGYKNGTVGPERSMTRGEVAQMFYNLLLKKDVAITKSFPDVPDTVWCAKAINTLTSLGIITGYSDGNYGPDDAITREQFCAIAVRFATKMKTGSMDYTVSFPDVTEGSWSYDSVMTAASMGWISGYSTGKFGPKDTITRAQVMTIVNHMLGRSADRSFVDTATSIKTFTDLSKTYWAYYDIMEATNAHDHTADASGETWTKTK